MHVRKCAMCVCDICQKVLSNKGNLLKHRAIMHAQVLTEESGTHGVQDDSPENDIEYDSIEIKEECIENNDVHDNNSQNEDINSDLNEILGI